MERGLAATLQEGSAHLADFGLRVRKVQRSQGRLVSGGRFPSQMVGWTCFQRIKGEQKEKALPGSEKMVASKSARLNAQLRVYFEKRGV